jgi:hypothetical protein
VRVLKPKPVLPVSIHSVCGLRDLSRAPSRMKHVLSGLWPGGAVLSKAARPKTVAPVSLAGFKPPAAAADPWCGS